MAAQVQCTGDAGGVGVQGAGGVEEVARFFAGLELVPPGVLPGPKWRPESEYQAGGPGPFWAGVARKP